MCVYACLPRVPAVAVILFIIADVIATAIAAVAAASWSALLTVGDAGQCQSAVGGGRQRETEDGGLRERWTKAADGSHDGNQGPKKNGYLCG